MESRPLISVCIPSYNNADFIAATLDSVLQQTWPHFEILVVDDHSTDATAAVVKRYSDPRIKLSVNEKNLGIGGNWQKALSLATGKYIKLLCGDDILYPDCLRRQVEALEDPAQAGVTLALCERDVIDAAGKVVYHRRARFGTGRRNGTQLIRACVRNGANLLGEPMAGLFRSGVLPNYAIFGPNNPYMVDIDLWAELLKRGDAYLDAGRLTAFRISPTSVSTQVGLKQAGYIRRFLRKIHSDPAYGTTRLDVWSGYCFSFVWSVLRNLLINLHAR